MEYVWTSYGIRMDCVWTIRGTRMENVWTVHEICMECVWNVSGIDRYGIMHRVCKGYEWNRYGR